MTGAARLRKPVILGAGGQLGTEFRRLLPDAVPLDRGQADIVDDARIARTLAGLAPDLVLNCAAYNQVDLAEQEPEVAFRVNAIAPGCLARACRELGVPLVHVSTDMVFGLDGNRAAPYREEDLTGPVNSYGASKLAGEHLVAARGGDFLIVRTCGLYGRPDGTVRKTSFVERILARARAGEALRVVGDQRCTPSSAADIAAGILDLLDAGIRGTAHLTNAGQCSWHEFATAIVEIAGVDVPIQAIASSGWPGAARRPGYTVLDAGVRRRAGLPPMPHWREALARFLGAGEPNAGRP